MDCKQAREGNPEDAAVRAHLDQCSECRQDRDTWALLGAYPPVEADVLGAVQRRIRSPWARVLRWAAPLAAAAALIITVSLALSRTPAVNGGDPAVAQELKAMPEEDRALFLELTKEENRELIENVELLRSMEIIGADQLAEEAPNGR